MESFFLFGLTIIFLVESFYESRLFLAFQVIIRHSPQIIINNQRLRRIIWIEQIWNWLSWVLLIALILLPNHYTVLLISIITLIETMVVHELDQVRNQIK